MLGRNIICWSYKLFYVQLLSLELVKKKLLSLGEDNYWHGNLIILQYLRRCCRLYLSYCSNKSWVGGFIKKEDRYSCYFYSDWWMNHLINGCFEALKQGVNCLINKTGINCLIYWIGVPWSTIFLIYLFLLIKKKSAMYSVKYAYDFL